MVRCSSRATSGPWGPRARATRARRPPWRAPQPPPGRSPGTPPPAGTRSCLPGAGRKPARGRASAASPPGARRRTHRPPRRRARGRSGRPARRRASRCTRSPPWRAVRAPGQERRARRLLSSAESARSSSSDASRQRLVRQLKSETQSAPFSPSGKRRGRRTVHEAPRCRNVDNGDIGGEARDIAAAAMGNRATDASARTSPFSPNPIAAAPNPNLENLIRLRCRRSRGSRRRALAAAFALLAAGRARGPSPRLRVQHRPSRAGGRRRRAGSARGLYGTGRLEEAEAALVTAISPRLRVVAVGASAQLSLEPAAAASAAPLLKLLGDVRVDAFRYDDAVAAYGAAIEAGGASAGGALFGRVNAFEGQALAASRGGDGAAADALYAAAVRDYTACLESRDDEERRTKPSASSSSAPIVVFERAQAPRCVGGARRAPITKTRARFSSPRKIKARGHRRRAAVRGVRGGRLGVRD